MNGFIDIHTHILPGVDDGAADLQEACRLIQAAWQDGTRTLLLTPHWRGVSKTKSTDQLRQTYSLLCQTVAEILPEMKLYLGTEIHYETAVSDQLLEGSALPLNGSQYVLMDFWSGALRSQIIMGVSEILGCGFTPIIAHVERYGVFQKDTTLSDEILEMGALIQLNAASIMGDYGFKLKRLCHRLLKAQKVHFVASDAHNEKKRPPLLKACYLRICRKYGQAYADKLFCENPQAVIENRML